LPSAFCRWQVVAVPVSGASGSCIGAARAFARWAAWSIVWNSSPRSALIGHILRVLLALNPAGSTGVEMMYMFGVAKALGLTFPLSLLGRADEVIE
jgi:hypothetical protein